VIDAVAGIDHDGLTRGAEQGRCSRRPASETEDLDGVADLDTLDIRVEPLPGGIPERSC